MTWWMWLLLILVFLSLVVLIILLLRWSRRRQEDSSEATQTVFESVATPVQAEAEAEPVAEEAAVEVEQVTETVAEEMIAPKESRMPEAVSMEQPPDDLKVIEGIGPKISSTFQAAGITTLAQLAVTEADDLKRILTEANIRLGDPTTWPEQARLAAEARWDELTALQDSLKGGRRV